MEARIAAIEAAVAGIQNDVSGTKLSLDNLFAKLEENDKNMKSASDSNDTAMKKALDDKFMQLEQGYVNMGDTVKNEMSKEIDKVRGDLFAEHQKLYDQVMGDVMTQTAELKELETKTMLLESKRILPMESQVLVMTQATAQLGEQKQSKKWTSSNQQWNP